MGSITVNGRTWPMPKKVREPVVVPVLPEAQADPPPAPAPDEQPAAESPPREEPKPDGGGEAVPVAETGPGTLTGGPTRLPLRPIAAKKRGPGPEPEKKDQK